MGEREAELGGELSGHFFFKELHYAESAVMAMLLILVSLSQSGVRISKLVKPFQIYAHSGEINIPINDQSQAITVFQKLKEKYKDGKIDETDGILVEYSDWWFSLRSSNTEP